MNENDAFRLLFIRMFNEGPLFKNQVDLVNELINTSESIYFTEKTYGEYQKRAGNLRVYISQLFSEGVRRAVTPEFKKSLEIVIKKKLKDERQGDKVVELIINDLIERNSRFKNDFVRRNEPTNLPSEIFSSITTAKYISIFSAREMQYELIIQNRKLSFAQLLLEDLLKSLIDGKNIKSYRFNFPLPQTCMLFWVGVQKEISQYLQQNRSFLDFAKDDLFNKSILGTKDKYKRTFVGNERDISAEILEYLSKTKIIRVFYLAIPIFLVPFVAINPDDQSSSQTYCVFQNDNGKQFFHKLSHTELAFWRLFVWENLKLNKYGKEVEYKRLPEFE